LIGASIGTVSGAGATDAEQLIHRADLAMYIAKRQRLTRAPS
jgi:predicted signal transduction protein with EAL and GGDEF domain